MSRSSIPLWVAAAVCLSAAAPASPFDRQLAGFSVSVRGEIVPYRVFGVYVLPADSLLIEIADPSAAASEFRLTTDGGATLETRARRWKWRAPAAPGGPLALRIERLGDGASITLQVFVLVPYTALDGETLNGYRIGRYPSTPLRGLAIYRPPRGFVEVTAQNRDTLIAPHFTLGQFLCKQDLGASRQYVVLRERLLLKLEHLLARVNEKGWASETFFVMSGYRTPSYNRAIGNVKYSRHMWGGAADIFIDVAPQDGMMDDLNGDGRFDLGDARALAELIEEEFAKKPYEPFIGGLGLYGTNAAHGPFVHVDARGFRARWGK